MKISFSRIIEKAIAGIISGVVITILAFYFSKIYFAEEINEYILNANNPIVEYIVQGRVIDIETEEPISNVIVGFIGKNESTDSLGNYEVKVYFRSKENKIIISYHHDLYLPVEETIKLTASEKIDKRININYEKLQKISK